MSEKSQALVEAEQALAELEKPFHAVSDANSALQAAMHTGDADKIEAATKAYAAAVEAKEKSGITDRDRAKAGQKVLDARGEGHTESGVLPSDFGVELMTARRAIADARQSGNPKMIADAEAAYSRTEHEHAQERLSHALAGHAGVEKRLADHITKTAQGAQ